MITFLLGWPLYVLVAACLIASAFLVTDWYWRGRSEHAVYEAEVEGFNAGWAAHARETDRRRNAIHQLGRTQVALTAQLPRTRQHEGAHR